MDPALLQNSGHGQIAANHLFEALQHSLPSTLSPMDVLVRLQEEVQAHVSAAGELYCFRACDYWKAFQCTQLRTRKGCGRR